LSFIYILNLKLAPISVRLKRKETTLFLLVDPADSFLKVKSRAIEALNIKGGYSAIQLLVAPSEGEKPPAEYPDQGMVSDYSLKDSSIIYLVMTGENIDANLVKAYQSTQ
jgi:hypothetical protein